MDVLANGRQLRVRFDSGDEHTFVWPSESLARVTFEPGAAVQVQPDDVVGVVIGSTENMGLRVYQISLPGGAQKGFLESGVRRAVINDPAERLRRGELDTARATNLRLTATRLSLAHQFDELSSLSNSRVEIKPHQVAVLHRVATAYPHRFLLADEVGLGKTIEAGLIIKELKARGFANRVLILAPSGIVSQWQAEMKSKFNLIFANYRKESIRYLESNHPGDNVWTLNDNVIMSATYASWDDHRCREIALADWDLVIIDEAHHARRVWEGESKYHETKLYKLAKMLADPEVGRSPGFLLLTATPMQLHRFELYSLVELIDPTLFPDYRDFEEHCDALRGLNETVDAVRRWTTLNAKSRAGIASAIATWLDLPEATIQDLLPNGDSRDRIEQELQRRHRLSEVLIRNRKAVVGGFAPRVAVVWPVNLTPQERDAYDAVTEYVHSGYARSQALRNNALGFLMTIFQKMNSSSSFALRQSLLRRIEKLEGGIVVSSTDADIEENDLNESPAEDALADWLGAEAKANVHTEIQEVARLVRLLDAIAVDSKARTLVERLDEIAAEDPGAKVIIFTQFRDTQEYIRRHIRAPWLADIFHGQLSPSEKDEAIRRFREGAPPRVLISTEAGGEGRNFQFCHILINYDLPWNPMRIEQRIGRVDRVGQKHAVTIINFSILGTIEERVLDVLINRIRLFEETIGGLDPVLGDMETDLSKVFRLADAAAERELDRMGKELEARMKHARNAERQMADLIMDTKSFRQDEVAALLQRRSTLGPAAMKGFVLAALADLDVEIADDPDIPDVYGLRFRGRFRDEFPQFVKEGVNRRVTFDPAVALDFETIEFLAFGHEMVDALVARARAASYPGRASFRRVRTNQWPAARGWLFTYVLEFEGVVSAKELLPVFTNSAGDTDHGLADWLLDRAGRLKREDVEGVGLPERGPTFEQALASADTTAINRLMKRQEELAEINEVRLEQEREKLTRYYEVRLKAAKERVELVRQTFDRISLSNDLQVQKIIPVWAKNVENAQRLLDAMGPERDKRLGALAGRESVSARHQLFTASFVEIVPEDDRPAGM